MTRETVDLIRREIGPHAAALAARRYNREQAALHRYGLQNTLFFGQWRSA